MASRLVARRVLRRLGVGARDTRSGPPQGPLVPHRAMMSSDATPRVVPKTYGTAPSHGTPEALAVGAAAERIVLPDVCEHLRTRGYAVVDGALGDDLARTLRDELRSLVDTPGAMRPNATVLVQRDATVQLEKSGIFEAEVHALGEDTLATIPTFRALAEDRSMLTLLNVMLPPPSPPRQLHHQSVKLQLNQGRGGCFPLHFDSDAALDGRRITALTYLNPDWTPGDGGELVLYPFPDAPVKVEPVMGRVVLFSAANMLHRVLPSAKPRLCFTTWFFAKSPEIPGDARSPGTAAGSSPGTAAGSSSPGLGTGTSSVDEDAAALEEARALLRPDMRKHLMRVVHAEEWAASIEAAHPDTPARAEALATHWKEVDVIARALAGRFPRGLARVAEASTGGASDARARETLGVEWFE
jgi:hypothetical protein